MVFSPVKTQRVYMHIADQIKALILKGVFPEGSQLPPERELAEQLQVSRASLREALSALQILGLVETRPGQGTFISPGASTALALGNAWPEQDLESPFIILQARKAVEPAIAALAAQQRSEASLGHLQETLNWVGSSPTDAHAFYEGDRKFHLAIAEATENPVLLRMMTIVHELMGQKLWLTLMMGSTLATPGRWRQAVQEHHHIYKSIEAQNAELAATRMKEHLDMVEKFMIEADLARSSQPYVVL
nr:FadR family transcriptional regulator [Chloroflexota bacterium]